MLEISYISIVAWIKQPAAAAESFIWNDLKSRSHLKAGSVLRESKHGMTSKEGLDTPLVSIIIPTYNRAAFIKRCLCSIMDVIANDYSNIEIIIVDGGSTDGTAEAVKSFSGKNLIYISESDNGAADAINKGLRIANGEIIRYFSDDDEMISGENAFFVRYLLEHPDVDVVAGQAHCFIENVNGDIKPLPVQQLTGEICYKTFGLVPGAIIHEATFFRKEIFAELGGYDTTMRHSFDVELWWRILAAGKRMVIFDKKIVNRFIQPTSNSQTHDEEIFHEFAAIFRRYRAWRVLCRYYWATTWRRMIDSRLLRMKRFFKIV
jgi:glycosyltransferase involved in cell wall biosynthesis